MKKKCAFIAFLLVLCIALFSCDSLFGAFADVDVSGKIHYGTGTYGKVSGITFTVTGGKGPYDIYYARTATSNESYAKDNRKWITEVEENEEYTYSGMSDDYASTGWYYYIWAVDSNGASGYGLWHID